MRTHAFSFLAVAVVLICQVNALTHAADGPADEDGWQTLFNGVDLSGWRAGSGAEPGTGWRAVEGELVREERAGDIWTVERFGDFTLDLEFLTKGNSGVLFRKPDPRNNKKDRLEIQIQPPAKAPTKHSCGSLYDCVAPTREMCKKDDWNRLVLTSAENRVQVVLNGETIVDVDLEEWTEKGKNPDGTNNKFALALRDFAREGHIGFQDHGAEVRFRNVRIKRLNGTN